MTPALGMLTGMQSRLAKSLPIHPTLTLHGQPVRALGRGRRGELIWPVHGGAPDDDGGGSGGDGGGSGGSGGGGADGGDKKFTQADIDRIATERADKAGRAERKKFYETLGLPEGAKLEDVKTALADAEKNRLAALGETERLKEEKRLAEERAAQLERDRDEEKKKDGEERHALKVESLLTRAGVGQGEEFDKDPAKRNAVLERAAKLLAVDVEVGADSDDIRKGIDQLKQDSPGLFTPPAGGGSGPGDGRPGSTPPAKRPGGQSAADAGRELALKNGWKKPAEAKAS